MFARVLTILVIMALFCGCGGADGPVETATPPETAPAPVTASPPAATSPPVTTDAPTIAPGAFLADTSTSSSSVLPGTVDKVKEVTDQDYFALKLPTKTAGYDSGIKGIYEVPTGTVYVLKFKSVQDTDSFFEAILQKLPALNEKTAVKTLSSGGGSQEIHHLYMYTTYLGTYVKKGIFIFFIDFNINEIDTEGFIVQDMPDVFLDMGEIEEATGAAVTRTVDFDSQSTYPEDVLPEGGSPGTVSSSTITYDLRLPTSPAYDSAIVGSYTTPGGKIYVFKYRSPTDAAAYFDAAKSKIAASGSYAASDKTLDLDGKNLPVTMKKTGTGAYSAYLIKKGLFVIYLDMGANEFEAESYIMQNMPYLFG